MKDDDEIIGIIIRVKNSDDLPDLENYIRRLSDKSFFEDLKKQNKLTVEEIQKLKIANGCDIFYNNGFVKLKSGDIRIDYHTGAYNIYLSSEGTG